MYACVYVYMCAYIYIYIYIYTHTHVHLYTFAGFQRNKKDPKNSNGIERCWFCFGPWNWGQSSRNQYICASQTVHEYMLCLRVCVVLGCVCVIKKVHMDVCIYFRTVCARTHLRLYMFVCVYIYMHCISHSHSHVYSISIFLILCEASSSAS